MQQSNHKGTIFSTNKSINCNGSLFDLSLPVVMGILNITDDSFYDGGSYTSAEKVLQRAQTILDEGGTIIDVGAVSTRPGAKLLPVEEEIERLVPVIKLLKKEFPETIVSVDTCWSKVAEAVAGCGADIINDISGGQFDNEMFSVVRKIKLPYILMHTQGVPQEMQNNPVYTNVVDDLMLFFSEKVNELRQMGVHDIILDPGFGFGKTIDHNYELMSRMNEFEVFELPILVGISRKSMIYKFIGGSPDTALPGTIALNTFSLLNGANILRVHDVKAAVDCVKIVRKVQGSRYKVQGV